MRVHVDKPWNDCLPIDNDHFGTIRHSNTISRPYLLDPAILDNDRSIVDDLGATHRDNICTFDGKQCRHNTRRHNERSEEHTSELQSLMRISYAAFGLKKTKKHQAQSTLPIK